MKNFIDCNNRETTRSYITKLILDHSKHTHNKPVSPQSSILNKSLLNGNIVIPLLRFNHDPFGPQVIVLSLQSRIIEAHILAHNIARVKLISLESFYF